MSKLLSAHEVRRVAVTAIADLRSVEKYLRGGDLRPMAKLRIELALKELGYGQLVHAAAETDGGDRACGERLESNVRTVATAGASSRPRKRAARLIMPENDR